jgi:hypothetical protein
MGTLYKLVLILFGLVIIGINLFMVTSTIPVIYSSTPFLMKRRNESRVPYFLSSLPPLSTTMTYYSKVNSKQVKEMQGEIAKLKSEVVGLHKNVHQ